MPAIANSANGALVVPERNHFFYGKLMDVEQFEKEQRYVNGKRTQFNRLVLGSGVMFGLNVVADVQGMVRIEPGVAVDGFGREIVVSEAVSINPLQPTDEQGEPEGVAIDRGDIEIRLAYGESKADLVPVLVPDCDTPGNCAPSTIREGFVVVVRLAPAEPPESPACGLLGELPLAPEELHRLLCARVSALRPEAPADPSVPLGRVTIETATVSNIDPCAGRRLVYSNALLYELILCLAERLQALSDGT